MQNTHGAFCDTLMPRSLMEPTQTRSQQTLIHDAFPRAKQCSLKLSQTRPLVLYLGLSHPKWLMDLHKIALCSFDVLANRSPPNFDPRRLDLSILTLIFKTCLIRALFADCQQFMVESSQVVSTWCPTGPVCEPNQSFHDFNW